MDVLRTQAKLLLRALRTQDPAAMARVAETLPHLSAPYALHDAQSVVARGYGFASWAALKQEVERRQNAARGDQELHDLFLANIGNDGESGRMRRLFSERPQISRLSFWAAVAGLDEAEVGRHLAAHPERAREVGGPLNAPALMYLVFSPLMQVKEGHPAGRRIAQALLAAGADPNSTQTPDGYPHGLSAIYGAVGRANDPVLARMLLEAGADPNDNESLYHAAEFRDHACLKVLLEHGIDWRRTNALNRMLDWEDPEGLALLLDYGMDPNEFHSLHQAVRRGRSARIVRMLVAAGADPWLRDRDGFTAVEIATWQSDPEVQAELPVMKQMRPVDELMQACWRGDAERAAAIRAAHPGVEEQRNRRLFPAAAVQGRRHALAAFVAGGYQIDDRGDSRETPLHQACWRGDLEMVQALVELGAPLDDDRDMYNAIPMQYAMHASQFDLGWGSHWTPDHAGVVRYLLAVGSPPPKRRFGSDEVLAELEAALGPES